MYNIYSDLEGKSAKTYVSVGQTVYTIPKGNLMRGKTNSPFDYVSEKIVSKVGSKYFYLQGFNEKYGLKGGYISDIAEYSAETLIYLTKEDLETAKDNYEYDEAILDIRYKSNKISSEDKKIILDILKKYD